MELLISGSYSRVRKPSDIENFIKNEVFIDQRNNLPMEMDAWGLWHSLEYYHTVAKKNITKESSQLLAIISKKLDSLSFKHNHWGKEETHYRFVVYFIALLIKLHKEGYSIKKENLENLINQSINWSEKTKIGLWFLHDSQELSITQEYHDYHLKTKVYGESYNNMLILNSHLNFTYTYLYYLNSEPINHKINVNDKIIDSAIHAYKHFFRIKDNLYFKYIDKHIRNYWFKYYQTENRLISKILDFYFHRIRLKQKYNHPILFFKDGYTERQVKLAGTSAQYHLVNLNDIAKLIVQLSIFDKEKYHSVIEISKEIVNKGLLFCVTNKNYHKLLTTKLVNYAIEYCEALALSFQWGNINAAEIELYCQIRNQLPPTPFLKGFDDIAFPANLYHNYQELIKQNHLENLDVFPVNRMDKEFIYIDIENLTYSLKHYQK